MKISIITVCYNSESVIRSAIESVLHQTYPNIEYIVIDGASKDNTIEIIKEYEPLFNGRMYWSSEPDNGLYDAMNKGIKKATGDLIVFINSDDLICDPEAIEKVVEKFKSNEQLEAIYANIFYVSQKDTSKIIRNWVVGMQKPFHTGWHPAHLTLYIKKCIYDQYGLFNLNYKLAADFELMLRFLDKYQIKTAYLNESLVKMRLGGKTNKSLKNIYKQNIECIKAFKENHLPVCAVLYPFQRVLPKLLQFGK